MLMIAKKFEFSASHCLARLDWSDEQNRAVYGKCAHPAGHGHNYGLEVIVSGKMNPETGMVFDASLLDKIVQEKVLKFLDHKNLNADVPWLSGVVPTSEVIVDRIWQQLEPEIAKTVTTAQLEKVVLHETSRIYAIRTRGL